MAKMIINGEVYSGSTNYASAITYIKEDGTKSTVQKELDSRPVNNNLLINSNFANPVNQRGQSVYHRNPDTGVLNIYTIDRWKFGGYAVEGSNYEDSSVTVNNDYITLDLKASNDEHYIDFEQILEKPEQYEGKTLTFSVKYRVNSLVTKAAIMFRCDGAASGTTLIADGEWHVATKTYTVPNSVTEYLKTSIWGQNSFNVDVEWAKLELGEVATPYVSRLYEEELELCQIYYQIIHNNLFPWSATTSDMVFHQHFKPMRITPTISIIEAALYLENQIQRGFTFRTDYKTNRRFNLYATKSYHGLKGKAYVGLFLNVALDAEL